MNAVRPFLVELRRATDTRAPRWAMGVALVIGLLVPALAPGGVPRTFEQFAAGVSVVVPLLVGLLAVMTFTADWATRAALVTFALTPRRSIVLVGRFVAVLTITVAVVLGIHALAAVLFVVLRPSHWASVFALDALEQVGGVLGMTVAVTLTSVAVAGLVLRTAPALVVAVFLPFLLTLGLAFAPGVLEWCNPYGVATWLSQPTLALYSSDGVGVAQAASSFVLWTAAPLVVGWFRQMRTEPR